MYKLNRSHNLFLSEVEYINSTAANHLKKDNFGPYRGFFLIPIFVILGVVIYRGNYIQPNLHKSVWYVRSFRSYFETYYWQTHGILVGISFLLGSAIFPRTTMMWFGVRTPWASLGKWGFWVAPRITVAFLTTIIYWPTNPEVCVFVWVAAYVAASIKFNWLRRCLGSYEEEIFKGTSVTLKVFAGSIPWLAALLLVFLILWLIAKLFQYLAAGILNSSAIFGGMVAVLILGCCLFTFRQLRRAWYGLTEIIFAVGLAAYTISRTSPHEKIGDMNIFTSVLGLSSSIYVVVRGLDNIGVKNLKELFVKLKPLIPWKRHLAETIPMIRRLKSWMNDEDLRSVEEEGE
ncbi:MAG TPA: hypothetical protein VI306_26250 [Pyrinomonadaceae bacterium]